MRRTEDVRYIEHPCQAMSQPWVMGIHYFNRCKEAKISVLLANNRGITGV
jgi:hypothetical protein